jgi:hypothetical protein
MARRSARRACMGKGRVALLASQRLQSRLHLSRFHRRVIRSPQAGIGGVEPFHEPYLSHR